MTVYSGGPLGLATAATIVAPGHRTYTPHAAEARTARSHLRACALELLGRAYVKREEQSSDDLQESVDVLQAATHAADEHRVALAVYVGPG